MRLRTEYYKKYYRQNKDKILSQSKRYYLDNKIKIQKRHSKYLKNRRQSDINFKIACNLRIRLSKALRRNTKCGSAVKSLGCSIAQFKVHIENKWNCGMSWGNYGEWHLDHITPLSSFDLTNTQDFIKACHYSNYQPLWAHDNLSKNNKITLLSS